MGFGTLSKRIITSPVIGAIGWVLSVAWDAFWFMGPMIGYDVEGRRLYVVIGFIALVGFTIQAFGAVLHREKSRETEWEKERAVFQKALAEIEAAKPELRVVFDQSDPAMWWKEERWCRITITNSSATATAANVKVRVMTMTPYLIAFKALPSRLGMKGEDNTKECRIGPKGTQLCDVFRWATPETDDFALWILEGGQSFPLPVGASCDLVLEIAADLVQPKSYVFRIDRATNGEPIFSDVTTI